MPSLRTLTRNAYVRALGSFLRWARGLSLRPEPAMLTLIARNQARQEFLLAWWRLALSAVPWLEDAAGTAMSPVWFEYALLGYGLATLAATHSRRHAQFWRNIFAAVDFTVLLFYTRVHLDSREPLEGVFAYVALALVLMLINSLRLSLRLLWLNTAAILAGYVFFFHDLLRNPRVSVGAPMLILIASFLGSLIVRNQIRLLLESHSRGRLRRFLSAEVADELERRHLSLDRLEPAARQVTVLFVDIRGFTTLSERLSPEALVTFLNQFFARITQAVFDQHGTVDKYIGDCVMALFGAPVDQPDDADRALRAALAMVRSIADWNRELTARGEAPLKIGIGLNTSTVVAGTVGTTHKLEYTVIGDGVNVASRVCALTKEHPYPILLTAATRTLITEPHDFTDLGETPLRGRDGAVRIFGLQA